jgi:hypothetical protein
MARQSRISIVSLVTCLVGVAVAACSGRVETRGDGFGSPGGNGPGGDGSGLGGGGVEGRPIGGPSGSPGGPSEGGGTGPGGPPTSPGGVTGRGGGVGFAGSPPTGPGCSPPSCGCSDCLSSCLCYGNDKTFCYSACIGGSGGSVGSPGCNPAACAVRQPPNVPLAVTGCCLSDGSCGVSTDSFSSVLGVEGGCQRYGQVGWPTSQCPLRPPLPGTSTGSCCRSDGTCGLTLDFVSLGCVRSTDGRNGGFWYCNPSVGVGGGGAGGAIGFSDGGVFPGASGQVASGGSRSIDQCVQNAQSDCERCVCKACNTSLDACFQDAGCPLILQCANQTGCTGIDCYRPDTCASVIDRFGGIGSPSVSLAIPLFGCAQSCNTCGFGP